MVLLGTCPLSEYAAPAWQVSSAADGALVCVTWIRGQQNNSAEITGGLSKKHLKMHALSEDYVGLT